MDMPTARDLMTEGAACATTDQTVSEAARRMRDLGVGALPICDDDGRLAGVITDRDIVVGCVADGKDPSQVLVAEFCGEEPVTIGADDDAGEALRTMKGLRVAVLSGEGRAFVAGGDVSAMAADPDRGHEVVDALLEVLNPALIALRENDAQFIEKDPRGPSLEDRCPEQVAALRAAGVDASVPEDIRVEIWRKFLMLATLAGGTAGGRCSAGDIQASPALSALAGDCLAEIGALARAKGVPISQADEAKTLETIMGFAAGMRASMAKDLDAGRPLEVDWLSGAVARLSAAEGLEAPAHRTI
ncbi:ketopantoate reductase C-terminal domain-containing protein, partial [uncultured Nocardioides sp.]|uniref:ketopantoate reductase C-terminal domain-containing protein n=1 Tax=uncultured Nocardioides sp. TaxID=198441 RepID=UPI002632462A